MDKYKLFFYKSTQRMDLLGRKMKKICSIFFHFFPWAQMTLIWIFLVKLRMDIKMANPWLHRNHQYRSKYYVLLSFLAYWKSPFRVRTPCKTKIILKLFLSNMLNSEYYNLYFVTQGNISSVIRTDSITIQSLKHLKNISV